MLYCSYDQYAAAGGSMTEQSFTVLCARASRLIDGLTFGRAEPHAKACESCRSALTDACVQIVELLAAQQTTGSVPGAVSVNNDGYARHLCRRQKPDFCCTGRDCRTAASRPWRRPSRFVV